VQERRPGMEVDLLQVLSESIERMDNTSKRNLKIAEKLENFMNQQDKIPEATSRIKLNPDISDYRKYNTGCVKISLAK